MDLYELSVQETSELLASRKVSAEELTRAYLERIQRLDPKIKSYVTVPEELALEQARDADQRLKTGEGVSPTASLMQDSLARYPDLFIEDPRKLQTVLRLHRDQKIEIDRRGPARQEQHG
jgi:hypothetical protein